MALLLHVLSALFGLGSWVAINGLWVELPLLVPETPEGWYLPSYLTILIQLANVGPLLVTLLHRFRPGWLPETRVVYAIVCLGVVSCLLHGAAGARLLPVAGGLHLLRHFPALHEPPASPLPDQLLHRGGPERVSLVAHYQPANFSPRVFFFLLAGMMLMCLMAFGLLNHLPLRDTETEQEPERERDTEREPEPEPEQRPMISRRPSCWYKARPSTFQAGHYTWPQATFIFLVLAWVNGLTNAVLPSVQSYSCLPYGSLAYHLSATLGAMANPLACFLAMFLPSRSLRLMLLLTVTGTTIGAYIMGMAVLSPCPWLVHTHTGTALMVLSWTLFTGSLSYVKVMIGVILREEGHSALLLCGAVVQLGSMLGALTMFPLVSVYSLFRSGDPCNSLCLP
uniref:Riboflavin transporter n=1 Tax=Callorhinchus milii TaxID=7868 RepID=A0A4W3H583_CALMI